VERYRGLLGRLLLDGVTGLRDMAGDAQVLAYLSLEARLDAPGRARRAHLTYLGGVPFPQRVALRGEPYTGGHPGGGLSARGRRARPYRQKLPI
jgi:hypothetical protein